MKYPQHLIKLIENLRRLPGVGFKSAERFAFEMMSWKSEYIQELSCVLKEIPDKLRCCDDCGCLKGDEECQFCQPRRHQCGKICLVASSKDVFSIEETREYQGTYHVLGGYLSPLEGKGPESLNLSKLRQRISQYQLNEIIIAIDSTLEGDATALYIKKELADLPVTISRLAFGLPMGSSLDYVDGGTLAKAFIGRGSF